MVAARTVTVTVPVLDRAGHVTVATILVPVGASTGGVQLPTQQTTGWAHTGVALSPYTGPARITSAGTVVDSALITSGLTIDAPDVTLRRSKVVNGEIDAVAIGPKATRYLIEDVEITCDPANQYDRSLTVYQPPPGGVGGTVRRLYAHGGLRGIDITGGAYVLFEDCFLAYNSNPGSGERMHASAVRAAGGVHHVTFRNTVLGVGASSWSSGILATYPEGGPNHHITVEGGLWIVEADNDGAYGIAAGFSPPAEKPNHDFTVTDLYVSTAAYPDGCPSGVGQNWFKLTGTNTWRNVRKWNPGRPDHDQPIAPG